MDIVIDTSVVIAVITNEPHRARLLEVTEGRQLLAPLSLHWEIGNAFSAMFKQRRMTIAQAERALALYQRIPIRFVEVSLAETLTLAMRLDVYAYDAYMLVCARQSRCPLVSLDSGLLTAARRIGLQVVEVMG